MLQPGQYRPVQRYGEEGSEAGLPVGQASCGVVTPGKYAGSNVTLFGALIVGVQASSCSLAEPLLTMSAACR